MKAASRCTGAWASNRSASSRQWGASSENGMTSHGSSGLCENPHWRSLNARGAHRDGIRHCRHIEVTLMCRNIKTLFNFEPPVTDEEIRAASLQFVRKVSGFNKPSKANEAAFLAAVDEIAGVSRSLLNSLETNAAPRNREEEAAKARARAAQRFV